VEEVSTAIGDTALGVPGVGCWVEVLIYVGEDGGFLLFVEDDCFHWPGGSSCDPGPHVAASSARFFGPGAADDCALLFFVQIVDRLS
jgi:hypothetical protein